VENCEQILVKILYGIFPAKRKDSNVVIMSI